MIRNYLLTGEFYGVLDAISGKKESYLEVLSKKHRVARFGEATLLFNNDDKFVYATISGSSAAVISFAARYLENSFKIELREIKPKEAEQRI